MISGFPIRICNRRECRATRHSRIVTDLTSDYQDKKPLFADIEGILTTLQVKGLSARVNLLTSRDMGLNLA